MSDIIKQLRPDEIVVAQQYLRDEIYKNWLFFIAYVLAGDGLPRLN